MKALLSAPHIFTTVSIVFCYTPAMVIDTDKYKAMEIALEKIEKLASATDGWQPERDALLFEILLVIEDCRRGKIVDRED